MGQRRLGVTTCLQGPDTLASPLILFFYPHTYSIIQYTETKYTHKIKALKVMGHRYISSLFGCPA